MEGNLNTSQIKRVAVKCEDRSENFKYQTSDKNFQRQFAHIYSERLLTLRPKLEKAVKEVFDLPIYKLKDLQTNKRCVIIGTLFKSMQLRPTILKEISEENDIPPQPMDCYIDESDELYLEDEVQRIILVGNIKASDYVTGVTTAIVGLEKEEDHGKFYVEEVFELPLPEQRAKPSLSDDMWIAFVSGLDLDGANDDLVSLQLLVDYLTGILGCDEDQAKISKITRCIFAGNCLNAATVDKNSVQKAKYLSKKSTSGSLEAMRELDHFLSQIVSNMNVTLLPGKNDPANYALPQQQFHKCMFPSAGKNTNFHLTTNPCSLNIHGFDVLGHSGTPLHNISEYSSLKSDTSLLFKTLKWRHLAPTAPDTLACYPLFNRDPFIVETTPHIFFSGNHDRLQHKIFEENGKEVLLLGLPRFSVTKTFALVNLKTYEVCPVTIDTCIEESS
ncbi:DgyrCDS12130 [Dimorphilus gyrociliatus]|uniref:DgyrCDS12130 n=1 Tax=Dimorphilus gyrociliatus TaxID=2664684 RepID=A0A7I8W6T1_9ANNE|nr:DgyrCDS12130 [Dimorphilus gyrociliatus]